MGHTPTVDAMRFAIKWHRAFRLDRFGIELLAKAYDEDVTPAPEALEQGVVRELVEAAQKVVAPEHPDAHPHAQAFAIADLRNVLAKIGAK